MKPTTGESPNRQEQTATLPLYKGSVSYLKVMIHTHGDSINGFFKNVKLLAMYAVFNYCVIIIISCKPIPIYHYKCVLVITYNAYSIRLWCAHEYSVQFARLRFLPTCSLCVTGILSAVKRRSRFYFRNLSDTFHWPREQTTSLLPLTGTVDAG